MRRILFTALLIMFFPVKASAMLNNYALLFDGPYYHVRVPDSDSLDLTIGLTIEAWIKSADTDGPHQIVSKWEHVGDGFAYIFKDHNDSDKLRLELSEIFFNDLANLEGNTSIPTNGAWVHVAATYDGNFARLYFNGNADGSQYSPGAINTNNIDVFIGGNGEHFLGEIDEVRIWNYARSEQQLNDLMFYSLSSQEEGLVGYWKFDEGAGEMAYDSSVYGNDGQIVGSHWILSDGPYGQSRNVVPEPSTMILLGIGLAGSLRLRRKR